MAIKINKSKKEDKSKKLPKKKSIQWRSKKVVLSASITLAFLLSLAAYYLVVGPQFERVGVGREFDLAGVESNLTERRAHLSQLQTMKENFEQINSDDISVLANILPGDMAVPEILSQLEAITRQSGVGLVSINIAEVEEEDVRTARQRLQAQAGQASTIPKNKDIKQVSIQIEISAFDYPSYKRLLEALQSHARLMDVEQFSYDIESDTHSLRIIAYFMKP